MLHFYVKNYSAKWQIYAATVVSVLHKHILLFNSFALQLNAAIMISGSRTKEHIC